MINSKQRAYLRGLANKTPALYQIGKDGITANMTAQLDDALEGRELIKIHVLENSLMSVSEAADRLAAATNSDVVQVIGKKVVLYRESKNKKTIELP
ncbi:MAG TPA: ribosome assembly RNA-binding protein YhbY [Candidatus Monoglobus merdigallinarum]|uniref:Ribosome assembly RNA-binding protein YhbY n=1 Tax=Candidatus Monoglobus merdigallinarum TaxID=2838698 RepID=A0A9D1PRW9_9FIRM|nr:ribosome assembly RNA-binding protein YhbY [Candidatus Monoglobus merdigallinarum]